MFREASMSDVFYEKLARIVEANVGEEFFWVTELAEKANCSRSQIHHKLKSLTGQSTSQFIRSIRLQRALELLEERVGTASEIAYKVGFSSPAYFNKCFKEEFGYTPGEWKKAIATTPANVESKQVRIPSISSKALIFLTVVMVILSLAFGLKIYEKFDPENQYQSQIKSMTPLLGSNSIAILPFEISSLGQDQLYYVEGIYEDSPDCFKNHLTYS